MDLFLYLLLFLKGALAGTLYNFGSLTSDLLVADFISKKGRRSGIICGFGISTSHILWSTLAAFALRLTYINLHEKQQTYTLIGSLIMFYFAYRIYTKKKKKKFNFIKPPTKPIKIYIEGLLLGLSSPSKIFGYAVIFATLGVSETDPELLHKVPLILGVFGGSVFWWLIYSLFMTKKLELISHKRIRLYQKIAAFSMAIVGVIGLIHSLRGWR